MVAKSSHICVCICTYKRTQLLKRLLEKLLCQETDDLFTYSIVVVDNDYAKSAKKTVMATKKKSEIPIKYYVEPEQNIALARNKAVKNANGDFIAFIDDDEFPISKWLFNLYNVCNEYEVDGSLGPVKPYFDMQPPKWLIKGKFCERPSYKTGTVLDYGETRTGNVLLRKDIFSGKKNEFRAEFGRTGGEDIEFFKKIIGQGCVFVWCEEAPVYETVPPERWKKSFYFKKYLRIGGLTGEKVRTGSLSEFTYLIKAFVALVVYALALPSSCLFGEYLYMKCLTKLFYYCGLISGFWGFGVLRYRDD